MSTVMHTVVSLLQELCEQGSELGPLDKDVLAGVCRQGSLDSAVIDQWIAVNWTWFALVRRHDGMTNCQSLLQLVIVIGMWPCNAAADDVHCLQWLICNEQKSGGGCRSKP